MNQWSEDWGVAVDLMHDEELWGEEVVWHSRQTDQQRTVRAVLTRGDRQHVEEDDQFQEIAVGLINVRMADIPDAHEFDVVTVPVEFQGTETERWVVKQRIDIDNTQVQFTAFAYSDRRYRTPGIERPGG
jgi:hypothetical protein